MNKGESISDSTETMNKITSNFDSLREVNTT